MCVNLPLRALDSSFLRMSFSMNHKLNQTSGLRLWQAIPPEVPLPLFLAVLIRFEIFLDQWSSILVTKRKPTQNWRFPGYHQDKGFSQIFEYTFVLMKAKHKKTKSFKSSLDIMRRRENWLEMDSSFITTVTTWWLNWLLTQSGFSMMMISWSCLWSGDTEQNISVKLSKLFLVCNCFSWKWINLIWEWMLMEFRDDSKMI